MKIFEKIIFSCVLHFVGLINIATILLSLVCLPRFNCKIKLVKQFWTQIFSNKKTDFFMSIKILDQIYPQ